MAAALLGRVDAALVDGREKGLSIANEALKSAKDEKDKAAASLAVARVSRFEVQRGSRPAEAALKSAEKALSSYQKLGDKSGEALARTEIAYTETITEKAVQAAETARAIFAELKDRDGELNAAHALIDAQLVHAGPEVGLLESQRALKLAKEIGSRKGEATVLQSMLGMHMQVSDADKAMQVATDALKLAQETKDNDTYLTTLSKILLVHSALKNPDEANSCLQSALKLFRDSGDKAGEAGILNLLAYTKLEEGAWDAAFETADQSLQIYKGLKDQKGVLTALKALLTVLAADRTKLPLLSERDMVSASEHVIRYFRELGDKPWLLQAMRTQAVVFFETHQPRQAMRVLEDARKIYKESGDNEGEETVLNIVISSLLSTGESELAMQTAGDLFALHLTRDDHCGQVDALLLSSNIHLQKKDADKALEVAKDALGIAKESGDKKLELGALSVVQRIHLAKNVVDSKALDISKEILAIARELGDCVSEANALFTTAQVSASIVGREQRRGQDYMSAIDQCQEAVEILKDIDNKRSQLPILEFIYSLQRAQSQRIDAQDTARDIVAIMQDLRNSGGEAGALILVAEADPPTTEALQSAEEAERLFAAFNNPYGQAIARHLIFKGNLTLKKFAEAQSAAEEAKALFKEAGDAHGQAVCANACANCLLQKAYALGEAAKPQEIVELCEEATRLAREALDTFGAIGDSHGRTLSMNIIKDMKKLTDARGSGLLKPVLEEGEVAEVSNVDALGLPMDETSVARSGMTKRRPRHLINAPAHGPLNIQYTVFTPKALPQRSDEHRQIFVVGQFPKLLQAVLKARPSLAAEAKKRVQKADYRIPRGVAAPMRLVSQEVLAVSMQEAGFTGAICNYVDLDRVSTIDITDLSLMMIRATMALADQGEPASLDFVTSCQDHAAPDSLPEMRHPLHGILIGIVRASNNEYVGQEVRLLDIEPPHKRTPVGQVYYKGQARSYVEAILRRGNLYVPKLVGSGMIANHPMQYEFVKAGITDKAWGVDLGKAVDAPFDTWTTGG